MSLGTSTESLALDIAFGVIAKTAERYGNFDELYHMTDADDQRNECVLSGADVVDELGIWIQRNHKLLRKLGIVQDDLH